LTAAFQKVKAGPGGDPVIHSIYRSAFWAVIFCNRRQLRTHGVNPVVPTQMRRLQVHAFLAGQERGELVADYVAINEGGDGR
jgi:hypothetical protein